MLFTLINHIWLLYRRAAEILFFQKDRFVAACTSFIDFFIQNYRANLIETFWTFLPRYFYKIFIEKHWFVLKDITVLLLLGRCAILHVLVIIYEVFSQRVRLFSKPAEFSFYLLVKEVRWALLIIAKHEVVVGALPTSKTELENIDFAINCWSSWWKCIQRFLIVATAVDLWDSHLRAR